MKPNHETYHNFF